MAVTENLYTGNGSTVRDSFTFPYLETTDIKVSVNGTNTNAYTLANATTVQFNTAPASSAAIRIYRQTDDTALPATFYPGSAIRSSDLNENFTQNLYVTQESNNSSTSAATAAAAATTTANTALSNSTAAQSSAATAISTANAASAAAASAVSTANTANSNAAAAVSTANTANTNATAALNAAAEALAYTVVANVAAIPASPTNGDAIRVTNSTGIQSFSPLSGKPVGFVGDSGLTVEIYYSSSTSTWVWVRYYPTDPESRYASSADLTQAQTDILGLDSSKLNVTTAASTYLTQSNASSTYLTQSNAASTYQTQAGMSSYVATSAIGTTVQSYDADTAKTDVVQSFTAAQRGTYVTLTDAATVAIDLSLGNHYQVTLGGNRTIGAPTNVVAGQSGVIRLVQDATGSRTASWNSAFKFPGGTAPTLTTAANSVDLVAYHVESTTRIAARFIGDVK
jgi:hypothetical protein